MGQLTLLFAYFGPDSFLPFTSVLAAVAGVFLTLGRGSIRYAVGAFRARGRQPARSEVRSPHRRWTREGGHPGATNDVNRRTMAERNRPV